MYSLVDYGSMISDRVRVEAYRSAIRETVAGKRVLEIGGGTGFFACLASRYGAASVTSIETNPLISRGPKLAAANGLRNIKFVHGSSSHFESQENFDVIIHDLRGNTPLFERSLATLKDASRFLNSSGIFLPRRDRIFAALVEDSQIIREMEGVWGTELAELDLTPLKTGTYRRMRYHPNPEAKSWEPLLIHELAYTENLPEEFESKKRFTAQRNGRAHGVVVWFETELTDNVCYTTNPWAPPETRATTYGVVFLPWSRPVDIRRDSDYQLDVLIDKRGRLESRVYRMESGHPVMVDQFRENRSSLPSVSLPTDFRFVPHPMLKPYRVALQGIERGHTVQTVVKRVQESADIVKTRAAAVKVVTKCVEFTRVLGKRGRERKTTFKFDNQRVQLTTNSTKLLDRLKTQISPTWKKTRTKGDIALEIRLQEILTTDGPAYGISLSNELQVYDDEDEALRQLELLLLHRVILKTGNYILLSLPHIVDKNEARLSLLHCRESEISLLDSKYRLVPYGTCGRSPRFQNPVPVSGLLDCDGLSQGRRLAILLQHCGNLEVLGDPVAYFHGLLKFTESS